jgi:hypothetical protein
MLMRRLAVTALAVALLVAAEIAPILSGNTAHGSRETRSATTHRPVAPALYGGEPHLPRNSTVPSAAREAAVRFVRDYASWSAGRVVAIPAADASPRVVRLLKQDASPAGTDAGEASRSVRVARAGPRSVAVTSSVGNFLIRQRRSRWVVVSLPGD